MTRTDEKLFYWGGLAIVVLGAVAVTAWGAMSTKDRSKALPVNYSRDVELGGGWRMLDVDANAKSPRAARENLRSGQVVFVLLNSKNAPFNVPWLVEVANRTASLDLPFAGSWLPGAPPGGPQMIDFGPEHVLQIA